MIFLTKKEIKFLSDYRKNNLSGLSVDTNDNVFPLRSAGEMDEFIRDFFKTRGIKYIPAYVDIQRGIFAFKSVGMHTDYGNNKHKSLIFPLKGNGNLQHFAGKDNQITESSFYAPSKYTKALILNDQKPHSFITHSLCVALIVSVTNQTTKKLLAFNFEKINT